MTAATASPVHVAARLDEHPSRWLWLVKWLLVVPHVLVLAPLWVAFVVLSFVAWVAILVTGRYPEPVFASGVLRWTWRVAYYAYGALGTDRYPPFTLAEVPDYPAVLEIDPPGRLSRGLALVKWLLALPHYLVVAFFVGGGGFVVSSAGGTVRQWDGGGLIGVLVLIGAVALLFTGRYPTGVFDLVLGLHRWVLRVVAYTALMTDAYPPFRLDTGGDDPAALTAARPDPDRAPRPPHPWSPGRTVAVVVGSLFVAGAVAAASGATALLVGDRTARDAQGYLMSPPVAVSSGAYAVVGEPLELWVDAAGEPVRGAGPAPVDVLGPVRLRVDAGSTAVFAGIGPADAVAGYLDGVDRQRFGEPGPPGRTPGGPPPTAPAAQGFWDAATSGTGGRTLDWTPEPGRWAVVVMNADGSPGVSARVSAGATAPSLPVLWTVLFAAAGAGLLVGGLLVALSVPRGRR